MNLSNRFHKFIAYRTVRILFKGFGAGAVLFFLVAGLIFGTAQTGSGRMYLARLAEIVLSSGDDRQVRIGRIEGLVPFHFRVDRIEARDRFGEWLTADKVVLEWSPAALLKAEVRVKRLGAGSIEIQRSPASDGREQEGGLSSGLLAVHYLRIDRLEVDRLALGEALLGERAVLSVSGDIRPPDALVGAVGRLRLENLEGAGSSARIDWTVKDSILTLDAALREDRKGLLHKVLGMGEAGAFSLGLQGRGPLDAWKGDLKAESLHLGRMEAVLGIAVSDDRLGLKADGLLEILRQDFPAALKGPAAFRLEGGYLYDGVVFLDSLDLKSAVAAIRAGGRLQLENEEVSAGFSMSVERISAFQELIGPARAGGRLFAEGRIMGSLPGPEVRISARLQEPLIEGVGAWEATGEFRLGSAEGTKDMTAGLRVEAKGSIKGLHFHEPEFRLPDKDLHWSADLYRASSGPLNIRLLEIGGESAGLKLFGVLDPVPVTFKGGLRLEAHDLNQVSRSFSGPELEGKAGMEAQVEFRGEEKRLSAGVKGRVSGLGHLPPLLSDLSGTAIVYQGRVAYSPEEGVNISSFNLRSESAELDGMLSLGSYRKEIDGSGRIRISRLNALSQRLGADLDGAAEIGFRIRGPLANPGIKLDAESDLLSLQGVPVRRLIVGLDAGQVFKRPVGRISVRFETKDLPVAISGDFAAAGREIALSDISLSAAGAALKGSLTLDLEDSAVLGRLEGGCPELSLFSAALGEGFEGAISFEADFYRRDGRQAADIRLKADRPVTPLGRAGAVSLRASLSDILGEPQGEARMEIRTFRRQGLDLETLRLEVRGRKSGMVWNATAKGSLHREFEARASGETGGSPDTFFLRIDSVEGDLAGLAVSLADPSVFSKSGNTCKLERTALLIGEGRMDIFGRIDPEDVEITADVKRFPLKVLEALGLPGFTGSGTGSVVVEGTPERPKADISFRVDGIGPALETARDFPTADLSAEMEYEGDDLRGSLYLARGSETLFEADLNLPVLVSISPLRFSLNRGEAFESRIRGGVGLHLIPGLFQMEDQEMQGRLQVRLDLKGRLEKPIISGKLDIVEGSYTHLGHGIILDEIRAEADIVNNRIILRRALATDGDEGILEADGWLDLDSSRGFPVRLDLRIQDGTLVRREDLEAVMDGALVWGGSLREGGRLAGSARVKRAEIRIPDRLPPDVVELEVREINQQEMEGNSSREERPRSRSEKIDFDLDLSLEIPGRVFIRGRGLDSEWEGDLKITGRLQEPVVTGDLAVVRGRYNFLGKPFSLERGGVHLSDERPPTVEASAEHRRSDMTTRIILSGELSNPDFRMESDPSMPEDEILSHLLFGRSASDLSALQALKLAQALGAMRGGKGLFDFTGQTRRLLRVDVLDIKQLEEENGGTAVSVGKYLRDDVYLEMEKGVGTEGGKLSVEMELTPNITIESEAGADAQGGVGLNWKWDY